MDVRRSSHKLQHGCHLTAERQNYTTLLLVRCVVKITVNLEVAGAPYPASQLLVFLHDTAKNRLQVVVFLRNLSTFLVHSVAVSLSCHPKLPRCKTNRMLKSKQQNLKIRRPWLYFWIQTLVFSSSSSTLVKVCRKSSNSGQVQLIDCAGLLWWCDHWLYYGLDKNSSLEIPLW